MVDLVLQYQQLRLSAFLATIQPPAQGCIEERRPIDLSLASPRGENLTFEKTISESDCFWVILSGHPTELYEAVFAGPHQKQ